MKLKQTVELRYNPTRRSREASSADWESAVSPTGSRQRSVTADARRIADPRNSRFPICATFGSPGRTQAEHGSVVLLLLLLLAIMAVYLASNNLVLNHLHRELGSIEKKQMEKFSQKP